MSKVNHSIREVRIVEFLERENSKGQRWSPHSSKVLVRDVSRNENFVVYENQIRKFGNPETCMFIVVESVI